MSVIKKSHGYQLDTLNQSIKLTNSIRYQIIFMISMALYNSPEFLTILQNNKQKDFFLLDFISKIGIVRLEYFFILVTLTELILLFFKTYLKSQQNYFLELVDRIIFPIQIYVGFKVLINLSQTPKPNPTQSNKILDILYLLSVIIIFLINLIKNFTLNFRYKCNKQKGFNRLRRQQYGMMVAKMIVTGFIGWIFPNQKYIFILTTIFFNILLNFGFVNYVIYQHPKIQYLNFLTQFYIWTLMISYTLDTWFYDFREIFVLNALVFIMYLVLGIFKSRIIVRFLQKKYIKSLMALKKHQIKDFDSESIKSKQKNFIIVLNVLINIFFQQQLTQTQILQWSSQFKSTMLEFIREIFSNQLSTEQKNNEEEQFSHQVTVKKNKKVFQRLSKILSKQKTDIIQKLKGHNQETQYSLLKQQSAQLLRPSQHLAYIDLKTILQNNFLQQHHPNQTSNQKTLSNNLIYQIIWKYLSQSQFFKRQESKNLKYFICYNFPDQNNVMRQRLFYCFYCNQFEKDNGGWLNGIETSIVKNYLMEKIGNHNNFNRHAYNQKSSDLLQGQNCNNKTQNEFIPPNSSNKTLLNKRIPTHQYNQKQCLQSQDQYFATKFNDIVNSNTIYYNLVNELQQFYKNQLQYLRMFNNLDSEKQKIITYYSNRRLLRRRIQEHIEEYEGLNNNKNQFLLLVKYIKDYFLNKNHTIAEYNFKKALQSLNKRKDTKLITNSSKSGTIKKISLNIKSLKQQYKQPSPTSQQSITCVVSGINHLGSIQISCFKFKKLMQIQQQNSPSSLSSSTSKHNINQLLLPLWRQKHLQLIKSVNCFDQPINHVDKRCYIISTRCNYLYEVKFQMYFFMKEERDLLLVLDIQYQQVETLQIMDAGEKTVFSHGLEKKKNCQTEIDCQSISSLNQKRLKSTNTIKKQSTGTLKKRLSSLFQNKQHPVSIKLFNQQYKIRQSKKNIIKTIIAKQLFSTVQNTILDKTLNLQQQNTLPCQPTKQNQLKFYEYKKSFNIYQYHLIKIVLSMIFSLLFFCVFFQYVLITEQSNKIDNLQIINDKISLQNQYILYDEYSSIDVGLLNNIVKENFTFEDQEEKHHLIERIFKSLANVRQEIGEKHQQSSFNKQQSLMTNYLYDDKWIEGENYSFMARSLLNQLKFYQVLEIFIQIQSLEQQEQGEEENQQQQQEEEQQQEEQQQEGEVEEQQSNEQEHEQQQSQQYTNHDSSAIQQLQQQLQQSNISLVDKQIITDFVQQIIQSNSFHWNQNGVMQKILHNQKQHFIQIQSNRFYTFILLQVGFIVITMFIVYSIYRMKRILLDSYNQAINVTDYFIRQFAQQCSHLKNELDNLNKSQQQRINTSQQSEQQSLRQTALYNKNNSQLSSGKNIKLLNLTNKRKHNTVRLIKTQKRSQIKLSSCKFIGKSILLPVLKYLILLSVSTTIYLNQINSIEVLQKYTQSLTALTRINSQFVNILRFNLYSQQIKQNLPHLIEEYEFENAAKYLFNQNKMLIIQNIFPYNEEIAKQILYFDPCTSSLGFQCPEDIVADVTSLLQGYSSLILDLTLTFQRLYINPNHKNQIQAQNEDNSTLSQPTHQKTNQKFQHRIKQSYQYVNSFLYLSDKITQKSYQYIKQNILTNHTGIFFVLVIIFVIDFISEVIILNRHSTVFHEEFLRIASWKVLRREQAYGKYVNISIQRDLMSINTDINSTFSKYHDLIEQN